MDGTHTSLRIALRFPFLCVAVLLTLIFAPRARAAELTDAQLQNRRCLECHGQAHIGELTAAERRQMVSSKESQKSEKESQKRGLVEQLSNLDGDLNAKNQTPLL